MRKILSLLTISLLVLFASCDLNQMPEFDDSNAFVAFDKAAMTIKEDGGTLKVPVTLASLKGMSETVTYTVVDGTAKAGVNFSLVSESTLTFTATERTQYIEFSIIEIPGVFTGDLRFTIELAEDGKVKPSAESACKVTIVDLDHPLAFILGTYSASAASYFSDRGPFKWDIKFEKDNADVSIVWISNIEPYFASFGYVAPEENYFYGVVNEDKTEIAIPTGQAIGYQDVEFHGFSTPDPDDDAAEEVTKVIIMIEDDGNKLVIPNAWGAKRAAGGWFNILYGGLELTKK